MAKAGAASSMHAMEGMRWRSCITSGLFTLGDLGHLRIYLQKAGIG
jgi:hypothetical protein